MGIGAIGIGRRIKAVRGGRTIPEFADSLLIHKSTLIRYEKEESYPDAKLILKFCEQENINPNWLLTGNGPKGRWAISIDSLHNKLREVFKEKFSISSKEDAYSFCEKMNLEISPEILLSYLSGDVFVSGKVFEKFCELLEFDSDYLENIHFCTNGRLSENFSTGDGPSATLDRSIFLEVLSKVENFIESEGLRIDKNKKSHLLIYLYENIIDGVFDIEDIRNQLIRIAPLFE